MKLFVRWLPLLVLAVLAGGQARAEEAHRRFDNPEEWAKRWDGIERNEWQKPLSVMTFLGIRERETLAEIGAGTGYFTRLLSAYAGPLGKVYAVDIEPAMLEYIENRKDVAYPQNIETVLAEPDDPKLPAGTVDLILICNTWHHIGDRVEYARQLKAALTGSGRVAIIDYHHGDFPVGPPPEERLSPETVIAEFEEAGWRLSASSTALPYQYLMVFKPVSEKADAD
jgi:predicted methyltransferase